MKSIINFLVRGFVTTNITVLTGAIAFFGFNQSLLLTIVWGSIGGLSSHLILKQLEQNKRIQQNQLTRKEYFYIQRNLKEAGDKIKRLNKALLGVRSIRAAKHVGKLQRMVYQVYQIVKKEPKKFFQADRFFFYHLDSVVELSERYVFLSRQQVKEPSVIQSLSETEQTLNKLVHSLEEDLVIVLSDDINQLNLELNVANQTFNQEKDIVPKERD